MRTLKQIAAWAFLAPLLLFSCDGETCCDEPVEEIDFTAPTPEAFEALREAALNEIVQAARFNADEGITFTSANGAVLQIPPGCLTLDGAIVFGNVDMEFIELYDRAGMLPPNKPTMGRQADNTKVLLVSGGVFYVNITQDGQQLGNNCLFQLQVPASLTGGVDPEMSLWTGVFDENNDLTWEPNTNGELLVEGDQYIVFFNGFGWTNIDRFFNDPRPKTTLLVLVTEGYNAQNASVYLSVDGETTGLAHLDTFDPETNMFSEHYGQLPIGLEAHLIFVSAEGALWRYAIKPIVVSENQIFTIAHSETQTATLADLRALIAALP